MLEVTVRCRIDEDTKEKVSLVLDQMGLTLSAAIRLFLKRIAEDGTFPFELNRSTHQDVSGIKAALIHMINGGQVSGQAFAGLLGDDFDSKANPPSGDARKGLPGAIPVEAKKVRKP